MGFSQPILGKKFTGLEGVAKIGRAFGNACNGFLALLVDAKQVIHVGLGASETGWSRCWLLRCLNRRNDFCDRSTRFLSLRKSGLKRLTLLCRIRTSQECQFPVLHGELHAGIACKSVLVVDRFQPFGFWFYPITLHLGASGSGYVVGRGSIACCWRFNWIGFRLAPSHHLFLESCEIGLALRCCRTVYCIDRYFGGQFTKLHHWISLTSSCVGSHSISISSSRLHASCGLIAILSTAGCR